MTKSELRRLYLSKRLALPYQEYARRNKQIFQHFTETFAITAPRTVHCYLASESKREAGTALIIMHLLSQPRVTIVTPRCQAGGMLTHHRFTRDTVLETNRWSIREPLASEPMVEVAQIDWVIIPLLSFDRMGYRVGYGMGFYDRFLTQCRSDVVKIGLSLESPVARITDRENHDIPLDYGITPERVWKFDQN